MRNRLILIFALVLAACEAPTPPPQFPLPDAASPGARIVQAKCSQCHGPPQPSSHTAVEWPGVIDRMQMHRAQKAYTPLTAEEREVLLQYMRTYARGAAS